MFWTILCLNNAFAAYLKFELLHFTNLKFFSIFPCDLLFDVLFTTGLYFSFPSFLLSLLSVLLRCSWRKHINMTWFLFFNFFLNFLNNCFLTQSILEKNLCSDTVT